jgi:hypothetical protein
MVVRTLPHLNEELLKTRILARTGTRLQNLVIQFSPDGVILLGETFSFYVKQLAQHGLLDDLPEVPVHNCIIVSEPAFYDSEQAS